MDKPILWMAALMLGTASPRASAFEVRPVCGFRGEELGAGVTFGGGVRCEVVADPLGVQGQVVRATYPAYEKGEAEWPAVYFRGDALATTDWRGWDALRLVILNPSDVVVDVGLCVSGAQGRYNVHVNLQPNVWNYRVYPMADIAAQTGVDIVQKIDVFMTRPAQEHTVFVEGLDLIRTRLPVDESVPLRYVFGSFEDDDELALWNRNGVEVEPSNEAATDGSRSLLLTFPAYAPGRPPWPSLQAWVAAGAMQMDDWSAYDTIEFDAFGTADVEVPLKLYLRDAAGSIFSRSTAIPSGESVTHTIRLDETGLDLGRVRQFDLFMSRPSRAYSFHLDSVRLVARPGDGLAASVEMIRRVREQLAGLPDEERRPFEGKIAALGAAVRGAAAEVAGPTATLEALYAMRSAVRDVRAWVSGSSRDVVAAKARLAARQQTPGALFGVAIADSMTKVMIRDMPLDGVAIVPGAQLELATNEFESLQVVVLGAVRSLADVGVTVSPLAGEGGVTLPESAVTVSVVGYVETKKPPYAVPYVGWWPDPILDFQQTAAVEPGEAVPFWVRVHVPPNAQPGLYRGRITVSADGAPDVSLPFSVRVFAFRVPEAPALPTATDFRNHVKQVYGELPEAEYAAKVAQFRDLFIRYKIDFDRIYRRARTDPENLDVYLDDLKNLRDRGLLRAFNICYVGTDRTVEDPDHPDVQQTIDKALTTLRHWVPILKEGKLLQYAYVYGYDEVKPEVFPVMAKVYGAIRAEFPDIPLMTTAYDPSFGTGSVLGDAVDIFVPLTPRYDPDTVAKARAQGRDVWWYICIGPKHPYANWLIEYDAIEARLLMGMMTAKYRPGGFLYYALTRWPVNKQPIENGPYTNWNPMSYKENNGDGSLFCAGPEGPLATIRAENFRDGMEDYAYFVLLEELVAAAEKTPAGGRSTRLGEALRRGRAGLAVGESVVSSMKEFTRDPAMLRAERARVAGLIEELRGALGR